MKKLVALLLAMIMMLSLCACGGEGQSDTPAAPTATPAIEISLMTPFSLGDFEIVIMGTQHIKKIPSDGGSTLVQGILDPTGNYIQVDFTIKYTGKTKREVENFSSFFTLEFGDGYILTNRVGLFVDSARASGWRNVYKGEVFEPLSEKRVCRYYFGISDEVKSNTEAPLLFVIDINGERATLNLR